MTYPSKIENQLQSLKCMESQFKLKRFNNQLRLSRIGTKIYLFDKDYKNTILLLKH